MPGEPEDLMYVARAAAKSKFRLARLVEIDAPEELRLREAKILFGRGEQLRSIIAISPEQLPPLEALLGLMMFTDLDTEDGAHEALTATVLIAAGYPDDAPESESKS